MSLLRLCLIATVVCQNIASSVSTSHAAETINIVSLVPGEGQLRDKFMRTEKKLERRFGGDTDVILLIDGQVGTEESMIATVRRGRAQLAMLSTPGTSAAISELSLLMAPFLFDSFEEADFVLDNYVTDMVEQLFADKGLHFIQWIDSGWFNIFARQPIRIPADIKNLRMRAAGGPAARIFLQEAGADVAQLPFADLVPGLQTGLLSGGATNTPMYRTVALYELAPYITMTRHGINPGAIFANKAWFDRLSPERQVIVAEGISPTSILRADVRREGLEAIEFSAGRGATIIELTLAERALWKAATTQSHEMLIEEIGGKARDLFNLIQDGKSAFAASTTLGAEPRDASR
ncbi:MAG: TRAP transporter substrate-binding protein [Rhodospirillaceae bacterium]